jgi:putative redox protein
MARMQVKVSQLEGVKFVVNARSHNIVCDQPLENGGGDSGMTPPELLLASLGSCAAYYAAEYFRTRNLATGGVEVEVTADKLLKPARLGNFHIQVVSPVALTAAQTEAMTRCVHSCLVHNTLLSQPDITIDATIGESAVAHR